MPSVQLSNGPGDEAVVRDARREDGQAWQKLVCKLLRGILEPERVARTWRQVVRFEPLGEQRLEGAIASRRAGCHPTVVRPDLDACARAPLLGPKAETMGPKEVLHLIRALPAQPGQRLSEEVVAKILAGQRKHPLAMAEVG